MSYIVAIIWYSAWGLTIIASWYASQFAIKLFDKKWKNITEEEENEINA